MANNIQNFNIINFAKSIVKNNNTNTCMPNFKGQLNKDCFEKQEISYDFSKIPKSEIEQLDKLYPDDKTDILEIYDLLSKSYTYKTKENAEVNEFFYNDLKKNILSEKFISDKKNKIELTKYLLKLKNVSNIDIPSIVDENFLSCNDLNLKKQMARFLNENKKIPNNDYAFILSKVQTPSNHDLQIKAMNSFMQNNEYDGDFIVFLIDNLKSEKDIEIKLNSYDYFKKLNYEDKNIFVNELKNTNTENIVKTMKYVTNTPDFLENVGDDEKIQSIKILADVINFKNVENVEQLNFKEQNALFEILKKHSINLKNFTCKNDFPLLNDEKNDFNSLLNTLNEKINPKILQPINAEEADIKTILDNSELENRYLQKLERDEDYKKLDDKSKKILKIATIYSTKKDSVIELKKNTLNLNERDFTPVYKILKHKDFLNGDIEKNAPYMVMDINDKNLLNMTIILSKTVNDISDIENKKNFIKKVQSKIESTNFFLPQIDKNDIIRASKKINIDGKNFNVANSNDIKDFYALVHAVEANLYAHQDEPSKKMEILKAFDEPTSDEIVCCSYIDNKNQGKSFDVGFIVNIKPQNMFVASGYDLHSPRHPKRYDIVKNYIVNSNNIEFRTYISDNIKKGMNLNDKEYKKLIKIIFEKYKDDNISFEKLEKDFPDVMKAYKNFINKHEEDFEKTFMKDENSFNEILVRQPKIQALYTTSLDNIDENYLNFAKENNLPIVLLNK